MSSLREVAEKADVSISTVSRVINNPDIVKVDTRKKVQKTMNLLNYQPNRVAQRLRISNGHSKLLGLIIPDIQNQFYSKIVRGIEDIAYRNNYAVMLCNSDEDPDKEEFYLEVLKSESVDGIIFPPIRQDNKISKGLMDSKIPLICVDRKFANETVDSVVINNAKGAYSAVSHLIELRHQNIALITSSPEFSSFQERERGYKQALLDHDLKIDYTLIKEGDPRKSQQAKKLALELFNLSPTPTALLVANNLMTLGVIEAINDLDMKIPQDISLVMFDDMPWATAINPPLTVIKQPSYEMGRKAAELFFQRISDPKRGIIEIKMEPELIIRSSTDSLM